MISIISTRIFKDNKFQYGYRLKHLNNIAEIVKHKVDNGFKLTDNKNIFLYDETTFIYNHLVKKKCAISYCDNNINFNVLDKDILQFDIDFNDF